MKISKIRNLDETPGLADYEYCLLKLLEKVTNGSEIQINDTGTMVRFVPGQLIGGEIEHSCPPSRGLSYFLEVFACLAPFCKEKLKLTLRGNGHSNLDLSIDTFKNVTLNILKRLAVVDVEDDGDKNALSLKINSRGTGKKTTLASSGEDVVTVSGPFCHSYLPLQYQRWRGHLPRHTRPKLEPRAHCTEGTTLDQLTAVRLQPR